MKSSSLQKKFDMSIPAADSNLSCDTSVKTSDLLGESKVSNDEYDLIDYVDVMQGLSPQEYKPRTILIVQSLQEEREMALLEAEEMRNALSDVMESVRILTRQIRTRHLQALESSHESDETRSEKRIYPSIADYLSQDSKRLSELISSNSILSSVGIDLMALSHSCRMVEENSIHISQEATASIRDLQNLNDTLSVVQERCSAVECCAKRLHKKNKKLTHIVSRNDKEKKLLVKEIKRLRRENQTRKEWDEQIIDSFEVHERIMMDSPRSLIKPALRNLDEHEQLEQNNPAAKRQKAPDDINISLPTKCESNEQSSLAKKTEAECQNECINNNHELLTSIPALHLSPSNLPHRKSKGNNSIDLTQKSDDGGSQRIEENPCISSNESVIAGTDDLVHASDSNKVPAKLCTAIKYFPFGKR